MAVNWLALPTSDRNIWLTQQSYLIIPVLTRNQLIASLRAVDQLQHHDRRAAQAKLTGLEEFMEAHAINLKHKQPHLFRILSFKLEKCPVFETNNEGATSATELRFQTEVIARFKLQPYDLVIFETCNRLPYLNYFFGPTNAGGSFTSAPELPLAFKNFAYGNLLGYPLLGKLFDNRTNFRFDWSLTNQAY